MFTDLSTRDHLIQNLIISGHDSSKYLCLTAETMQTTSNSINNACYTDLFHHVLSLSYCTNVLPSQAKIFKNTLKNFKTATV